MDADFIRLLPKDMHRQYVMEMGPLDEVSFRYWILQSNQFDGPLGDYIRKLHKSNSSTQQKVWKSAMKDIAFVTGRIPRHLVT